MQAGSVTGTDGVRRLLRVAFAAIVLPVLATVFASIVDLGPFGPPSLYLLAVVVASAVGGAWSGIAAAAVSLVGLNYYFTEPFHTLRVDKAADVVALLIFLLVAVVVGALFARAVADRERAERQEEELRMVNRVATSLLSTELSASTIGECAAMIAARLGLRSCTIDVRDPPELSASVGVATVSGGASAEPSDGHVLDVPIGSEGSSLGMLIATRPQETPFTVADRRLLQALAGLLGLALERNRLDMEARDARTDAEVSEIRAALFSSVTHDLRTPLASIKAGVTSLMDEGVRFEPEERTELLTTVLEETDRLNRLLDNVLNLARARAGDVALERELTPFEDVVETVLARLRGPLSSFELRTRIDDGLPGVWLDPVKMDQALTNIIENATEYSPAGSIISVAVSIVRQGIEVRVADHGPGIPKEERAMAVEPFYRGTSSSRRPGSGLGLAIARAVVIAHGGSLLLGEAPGGGLAVVIELPVGAPPAASGGPTT
jgi:two-component system, OmpR family, sensor histidine kinase KdpD